MGWANIWLKKVSEKKIQNFPFTGLKTTIVILALTKI